MAAGGDFNPVGWTDAAWQDGLGILPVPLKACGAMLATIAVGRPPSLRR